MKRFMDIRNKGFSLVELIIVVAIMVALVAVFAPSYVKYVVSARDAVIENAAESISDSIKLLYSDGTFESSDCVLLVFRNENDMLDLDLADTNDGSFKFEGKLNDTEGLKAACGFLDKPVKSDKQFTITVTANGKDAIQMSSKDVTLEVDVEEVPEIN